jgi:hypothetical protein
MTTATSAFTKSLARQRMERYGQWRAIDALLGGIVKMREEGKVLMPQRAKEPEHFYTARLNSASLFEAFKDSVGSIVAKPFSKGVQIKGTVPPELAEMMEDVDGEGSTLDVFLAQVMRYGWAYGGCHVLVDFPPAQTPDGVPIAGNLAEERALGLRPYFSLVRPHSLLGARYKRNGARWTMTQARIEEREVEASGTFEENTVRRVRIFEASADGVSYSVVGEKADGSESVDGGGPLTIRYIPLHTFAPGRIAIDYFEPPLSGVASLNVTHWQSGSLQRNSLDIARSPVLVLLGFPSDVEGEDPAAPRQVTVSANTSFQAQNTDAKAFYCEHSGAALAAGREDLRELREQMEVMSLQPWIQRPTSTATGIVANEAKAECQVQRSVRELERFARALFQSAADWIGVELPADFEIDIYDDFGVAPNRAQDVASLIQARAAREISHETFLAEIKRRAVLSADLDIEAEMERVAEEKATAAAAFGGGFPFGGPNRTPADDAEDGGEDPDAGDDDTPDASGDGGA